MKLLFTADWQAHPDNLHKLKIVVKQCLETCLEYDIKHLFIIGDLKEAYDPVAVGVINFMVQTIARFHRKGIQVVIVRGNHDRIGMQDDTGSWLPTLRAAGAIAIVEPDLLDIAGINVFAVPFMSDTQAMHSAITDLATQAESEHRPSILLFHCEVNFAKLNRYAKLDGTHVNPDVFAPFVKAYGGHIHMRQKLGNKASYVGSPFCQDWGEANQRKGLVMFDTETRDEVFLPSKVPGMFDPRVPGFAETRPRIWHGEQIRIHAPTDQLVKAKITAQRKYPGAIISVVPEVDEKSVTTVNVRGSDEDLVKAYVKKNLPTKLKDEREHVISYLLECLSEVSRKERTQQHVTLLSVQGKNFQSFKDVKLEFKPGITVVLGENRDGPGTSNGAGKTTLLNLPCAALFGKTMKGQSTDALIRNKATKPCVMYIRMTLEDQRLCEVTRKRQPTGLRIAIDGKARSSGIGMRGTQQTIERVTGLAWETFCNAVYVSQTEVSQILQGTDTERKAIFAKLLNLERLELARKKINEDRSTLRARIEEAEGSIHSVEDSLATYRELVRHLGIDKELSIARRTLRTRKTELDSLRSRLNRATRLEIAAKATLERYDRVATRASAVFDNKFARIQDQRADARAEFNAVSKLESGVCPVCDTPIEPQTVKLRKEKAQALLDSSQERLNTLNALYNKIVNVGRVASSELDTVASKRVTLSTRVAAAERTVAYELKRVHDFRSQQKRQYSVKAKIAKLRRELEKLQLYSQGLKEQGALYDYCWHVFGKDGLAAFMTYQICPRLNAAVSRYSELFAEGKINVKFVLDDNSDIDVKITNRRGGKEVQDQSGGESRIAGIITSFAAREVINPCNVLILDEPGEGLDARLARLFAKGLKQIAQRFGSVLVTSHNSNIIAELASERTLLVVKEKGVSRVFDSSSNQEQAS